MLARRNSMHSIRKYSATSDTDLQQANSKRAGQTAEGLPLVTSSQQLTPAERHHAP